MPKVTKINSLERIDSPGVEYLINVLQTRRPTRKKVAQAVDRAWDRDVFVSGMCQELVQHKDNLLNFLRKLDNKFAASQLHELDFYCAWIACALAK